MDRPFTPEELFGPAVAAFDAQNYIDAAALYARAANVGHSEAMNELGAMLSEGFEGVPQDDVEAYQWYSRSADAGYVLGQYNKADALLLGVGTDRNPEEAVKFFKKAAAQGDADAKFDLAMLKYTEQPISGLEDIDCKAYFQEAWAGEDSDIRERLIGRGRVAYEKKDGQYVFSANNNFARSLFYWFAAREDTGIIMFLKYNPECLQFMYRDLRANVFKLSGEEIDFYGETLLKLSGEIKVDSYHHLAWIDRYFTGFTSSKKFERILAHVEKIQPRFGELNADETLTVFSMLQKIADQSTDPKIEHQCRTLATSLVAAKFADTHQQEQGRSAPATTATLCCYHCMPTGEAQPTPTPQQGDGNDRKFNFFGLK